MWVENRSEDDFSGCKKREYLGAYGNQEELKRILLYMYKMIK